MQFIFIIQSSPYFINFVFLDRSWARKAKGSGPKKRPALLAADFLFERDRTTTPTTPSPVIEVKGSISAPEEESIPRASKEKVESWLQGTEFSHPVKVETRKYISMG